MFEKAIIYFERAFQIQPKEVKWQLMIASCYRRMNLFNEALKVYEDIHEEYPDNADCLRGLVQIRKELGMKYQHFSEKLMIIEREEEAMRLRMGGQQNQYGGNYYGNEDQGYNGFNGQMEDPGIHEVIPKNRAPQKMVGGQKQEEDDNAGWDGVDGLLD